MIDFKRLRYFVVLAETRHFGRAAARLHLSQPPLSRQLIALEKELGVRLIERGPRGVTLTAAGERFYIDAKAVLAALEQAQTNCRAAAAGTAGALSLGFTMCAAYSVVPGYARRFSVACPDVDVSLREVVSNDLSQRVVDGSLDAAIMFPGIFDKSLTTETIFSEPLCVALPRGHRLAKQRRIRIAQLAEETFVLAMEEVAPKFRAVIDQHCRSGGFEPVVGFEVQLQQTVLSLVNEEAGVALVPRSMSKSRLAGVVFRELVDAPFVEQVLVWSRANRNPCLKQFIELVQGQEVSAD
ncbi:LysR family transcriptional regulator [Caballeronia sp. LZ035]|uniref:LysR family transcriptional regulator n=1 Tax=Caballeronia sp. LZ035 TaxID=3038568 RepID=UPI0028617C4A|nr:LysR family transcriptional regulator [Caballeronia sp. LZ035]MDR5759718.1 LysR family transcriptional regulator [Caballeronia sp. LZ035]